MHGNLGKRRVNRMLIICVGLALGALLIGTLLWSGGAQGSWGLLPGLLLLACPLMHLLMHRHHRADPGEDGQIGDGVSPPPLHPHKLRGR